MNKYKINMTAHYKKTVTIYAKSPAHAREKMETILFDTDLIDFTDDDFISGEAVVTDANENDCEYIAVESEYIPDEDCSECAYCCPVCGSCMCKDED